MLLMDAVARKFFGAQKTNFALAEIMPPLPRIMLWNGGDHDDMSFMLETHTPMTSKILGKTFLLHCPSHIHECGKGTAAYRTWYKSEYTRHVNYLARQCNPKAQRVVVKHRDARNQWQKRMRESRRLLVQMERAYEHHLLYGRSNDDSEENLLD